MRLMLTGVLLLGFIMIFFSSEMAYAEVTIIDREKISSLNSTTFDGSSLGIEPGNRFGYHITNIDDLDGDGIDDLAVSQYEDDFPNVFSKITSGSLSILFMNANGTVKNVNKILHDNSTNGLGTTCIDDYDAQVDDSFAGFESSAYLGNLINGNPTLAVGAPYDNITRIWSGAIYILELTTGGEVNTCTRITDNQNGFTPDADKYSDITPLLGFTLVATDLDGDGTKELVTNAGAENTTGDDIWSLFLRDNSGGGNVVDSFQYVNATEVGIVDAYKLIQSGSTIDGGKKIVIGSYGKNSLDVSSPGAVFIINFNSDGTLNGIPTQINATTINPAIPNDQRFGSGVAVVGDLNDDGILDIMVGNEAGDDTHSLSGEVYILFMNSDDTVKGSKKISNESESARTGETPFSASGLFGHGMVVWMDSGGQTVIAMGAPGDNTGGGKSGAMYLFYIENILVSVTKSGSDCADCVPPTFGKNKDGKLLVSQGFIFNGNPTDVTDFHTPFPLITVITNQTNTVTVKVYENSGVSYIDLIQLGLGMPEVGSPLNDAQVLLEFWIDNTEIYKIVKVDKNNLVDVVNATTTLVGCLNDNGENCLELSVKYIYRDQPKYNIMAINAVDFKRNTWNNYMNEGIEVVGESLNDPLLQQVIASKGGVFYPQKAGEATLTLSDYKTDMWTDEYGYVWSTNEHGPYLVDIIPPPVKIPDEVSPWSGYNDRWHSEFGEYVKIQQEKAAIIFDEMNKQERNGKMNTAIIPDSQIVFDRIDRDDPNISQSLIKEAQRILVEYEKQNKLDNSHKYEKSIFAKTIKAILVQETSENHTQKTKSKLFVDVDILNNVLTVSGNIGDGDTDIPIVLKSTGSGMTLLEGFFANNDGSFSQGFLSHYYADFVLSQGDIILKEFEYSTIK